jgi:hypothetical protein
MEEEILDTYFFNLGEALQEAQKQNKIGLFNDLQICYYNGPQMPNNPYPNLISLPTDDICDYMSETPNRMIRQINFGGTFSEEEQSKMSILIHDLQKISWKNKAAIGDMYRQEIAKTKLDFTEPLRVLFITTRTTTVLQYVAKNVADAFDELGCDTFVSIEQNAMQSWGSNDSHGNSDFAWHLKNIHEFNPHIIFNLDWINNSFLGEDVFNFIWFQDPMEILYSHEEIKLRDRDYVFILIDDFKKALMKKGVLEEKIMSQPFATNPNIFYRDESIKKENKIVFLGSDYSFEKDLDIPKDIEEEIYKDIEGNTLSNEKVKDYASRLRMSEDYVATSLISSFVRRRVIIWMCSLENIEVEVYGTDKWLDNKEVAPFYKGLLPYGEEMSKVYNSATYAISAHPLYRYQQRVFEMSACDTIPLVYKCGITREEFFHEDNILSFSKFDELKNLIGAKPKKDSKQISEDISYKTLAQKIIDIVKNEVNND